MPQHVIALCFTSARTTDESSPLGSQQETAARILVGPVPRSTTSTALSHVKPLSEASDRTSRKCRTYETNIGNKMNHNFNVIFLSTVWRTVVDSCNLKSGLQLLCTLFVFPRRWRTSSQCMSMRRRTGRKSWIGYNSGSGASCSVVFPLLVVSQDFFCSESWKTSLFIFCFSVLDIYYYRQ
jgi:hypothetical protein